MMKAHGFAMLLVGIHIAIDHHGGWLNPPLLFGVVILAIDLVRRIVKGDA